MVIKKALEKAETILNNADIESFHADSLILLCYTLNITKEKYILIKNNEIKESDAIRYFELIDKRSKNYPIKYILGKCEFMGLDFKVSEGVLIPRPETEILVEKAISLYNIQDNISVCDICCGSGCIGLSIISFLKNAFLTSYDISDTALSITKQNAALLGIFERTEVIKKDILSQESGKQFDLIVSNPPYIPTEEYNALMPDVKLYEPEIALHSPSDPLKFYKRIIEKYTKNLKKDGYIFFEVGYNQADAVKAIIDSSCSYTPAEIIKDYSGIKRVVYAKLFTNC